MILEPVVVTGLDEDEYHAHPALSASGAKRLLPPGCPAVFAWERENGRPNKPQFDLGHAAHQVALGVGKPIYRIHAEDWKSPKVRAEAEQARGEGFTPLLVKDVRVVLSMAKALRRHPVASRLFDPEFGDAEVSVFWHDERYGVDRRCRFDWLPHTVDGRALIVGDYKTAVSSEPEAFARQAATYRYHMQAAWYQDAAAVALGVVDPGFVFIVQEKTPPYIVTPVALSREAVEVGRARNHAALERFADCTAAGVWPGYSDEVVTVDLPVWATREWF